MGQCEALVQMLRSCNGPTQWLCLQLTVYYDGPYGSFTWQPAMPGWANVSYLSKWYVNLMGPWEGLCLPLTEHYVGLRDYAGPRDSLMQQLVVSLVGQCQLIVQMSCSCNGPT